MNQPSFAGIVWKAAAVHTVTYFLVGVLSFVFLDYSAKYADPAVAVVLRQTDHPMVSAGPLFQVLRGLLFGIVFYILGEVFFRPRGWLRVWLVLLIVGVFSPFGAAPGSIEGAVYTTLPGWFHLLSLPEIVIQSFLLAVVVHYWVNHPQKKWLGWLFGAATVLIVLLASLGVLAALGLLPQPV